MNFKILISILMNEELVKETTFQSSPNFLFLMKTLASLQMSHCQMYLLRKHGFYLYDFCILGTYHAAGHNVFIVSMSVNIFS